MQAVQRETQQAPATFLAGLPGGFRSQAEGPPSRQCGAGGTLSVAAAPITAPSREPGPTP